MNYVFRIMKSPVGELKLIAGEKGLAAVLWPGDQPTRVNIKATIEDKTNPILIETENQLTQYFAGQRKSFTLTFDLNGTDFQKKVWQELAKIPFGETRSYREIAKNLNNPKAVRAVGAANGKNPISIIVPCHRVIGSDGKLTGFAGGLDVKQKLLEREGFNRL